MRLHRNLCFATIDGLMQIFNEGEYADKVIQQLLKRDKRWGSRDRAFVAETTYDIVRWKRLYAEIADVKEPFDRDNLWRMFAVWATLKGIKLPDWKYFENTPTRKIKGRFDELSKDLEKLKIHLTKIANESEHFIVLSQIALAENEANNNYTGSFTAFSIFAFSITK